MKRVPYIAPEILDAAFEKAAARVRSDAPLTCPGCRQVIDESGGEPLKFAPTQKSSICWHEACWARRYARRPE